MTLSLHHRFLAGTAAALVLVSPALAGEVALKGATPGKWTMDYDAALKLAQEKDLPLLLNFTGSDWCGWCKLMDKDVYAKPAWETYASANIVTVTIDFPQNKSIVPAEYVERNEGLRDTFEVQGYPTYVVVDSDGTTVLGQLGAGEGKTPETFIEELDEVLRYRPANVEAKIAALGEEKGAAYRTALEGVRGTEKALMEWLQSAPERNEENDKKFEAFLQSIETAKEKVASF